LSSRKHPLVRFIEWLLNLIFGSRSSVSSPPPGAKGGNAYPYAIRSNFLTELEVAFDEVLLRSLPHRELRVHRQVRLADILQVIPGSARRQHWFNRISAKSIDFLICLHQRPLAVIELDDATHRRKDRQDRDAFLDAVCDAAQLPILHVAAAATYDESRIREFVIQCLLAFDATLKHELMVGGVV
jgi:hypothetical protein